MVALFFLHFRRIRIYKIQYSAVAFDVRLFRVENEIELTAMNSRLQHGKVRFVLLHGSNVAMFILYARKMSVTRIARSYRKGTDFCYFSTDVFNFGRSFCTFPSLFILRTSVSRTICILLHCILGLGCNAFNQRSSATNAL